MRRQRARRRHRGHDKSAFDAQNACKAAQNLTIQLRSRPDLIRRAIAAHGQQGAGRIDNEKPLT